MSTSAVTNTPHANVIINNNNKPSATPTVPSHHQNENKFEIEEKSVTPKPNLVHKIIVQSEDGKRSNLLCPFEIFNDAPNTSAPLIPSSYDQQIFASTPHHFKNKSSKKSSSSRKRKNESNNKRNAKRRKKSHHQKNNNFKNNIFNEAEEEDFDIGHKPIDRNDKYFEYNSNLNVNSRPKRNRKKVSYIEPDSNIIPLRRAPLNRKNNKKKSISPKSRKQSQPQPPPQQQQQAIIQKEKIVEMKWVQCDKCMKWRRIPTYVNETELEGQWFCRMNKWDLKRSSCDAQEEPYNETEEQTVEVTNGKDSNWGIKKQDFHTKLQLFYQSKFMKHKNLTIQQLNYKKIGNKNVDFLQLYLEITKRGGYHHCITTKLFDQIFRCLECFNQDKVNEARNILPNLYAVYLMDYERKYFVPLNGVSVNEVIHTN